jgi:hypothetical protein
MAFRMAVAKKNSPDAGMIERVNRPLPVAGGCMGAWASDATNVIRIT